jgi:hypothetical protein
MPHLSAAFHSKSYIDETAELSRDIVVNRHLMTIEGRFIRFGDFILELEACTIARAIVFSSNAVAGRMALYAN